MSILALVLLAVLVGIPCLIAYWIYNKIGILGLIAALVAAWFLCPIPNPQAVREFTIGMNSHHQAQQQKTKDSLEKLQAEILAAQQKTKK